MVCRPWSAVRGLLSVVCRPWSVVRRLWSVVHVCRLKSIFAVQKFNSEGKNHYFYHTHHFAGGPGVENLGENTHAFG